MPKTETGKEEYQQGTRGWGKYGCHLGAVPMECIKFILFVLNKRKKNIRANQDNNVYLKIKPLGDFWTWREEKMKGYCMMNQRERW